MVTLDDLIPILEQNHVSTFTTFRRDGRPQMSLVTIGRVGNALGFTTRRRNAKHYNLLRDARCAMMMTNPDLRTYAVLDGDAQVIGQHNTNPDSLRLKLREVYQASAGKEHPDWDEFDSVMVEQQRSAILLIPSRIYAHNL